MIDLPPNSTPDSSDHSLAIGPVPGIGPLEDVPNPAIHDVATPLTADQFFYPKELEDIGSALDDANIRKGEAGYGEYVASKYLIAAEAVVTFGAEPKLAPGEDDSNGGSREVISYSFVDPRDGETKILESANSVYLPRELRGNPLFTKLFDELLTDPRSKEKIIALKELIANRVKDDVITGVPEYINDLSVEPMPKVPEQNPAIAKMEFEIQGLKKLLENDESFSEVRNNLNAKKRHLSAKGDAQKRDDGYASTQEGQYAAQAENAAKDDPNYPAYEALQRKLNELKVGLGRLKKG